MIGIAIHMHSVLGRWHAIGRCRCGLHRDGKEQSNAHRDPVVG